MKTPIIKITVHTSNNQCICWIFRMKPNNIVEHKKYIIDTFKREETIEKILNHNKHNITLYKGSIIISQPV